MYDQSDFEANPGKYELFRTAQVAIDGLHGFERDQFVAVEYVNAMPAADHSGVLVPCYHIETSNGDVTHVYANALMNFCL